MTTLLVACAVTVVFMFCQDVLGSSLVVAEARSLRFWPGLFDGLGDLVSRYGAVVAAVTAVHFGIWSWQMLALAVLTAITSFFTSNVAVGKASMLLPKSQVDQVRVHIHVDAKEFSAGLHLISAAALRAKAALHLMSVATQTPTKGEEPMSLLDTIEARFKTAARTAVDDVEEAAHSKIGTALVAAAKEILPLIPEGREASLVITKLEEVEAWAHRALSAGSTVVADVTAVTDAVAPPAAEAAPAAAAPVTSTTSPPEAAAPVPPAATEAAPPAAPATQPAPPNSFTTTLDASAVDVAAWPVAPFKTADGRQLYTWAGPGAAPADGTTWVAYSGDVVAA